MINEVLKIYEQWGYDRAVREVRDMCFDGRIAVVQRQQIMNVLAEREMGPSQRSMIKKVKKSENKA